MLALRTSISWFEWSSETSHGEGYSGTNKHLREVTKQDLPKEMRRGFFTVLFPSEWFVKIVPHKIIEVR